MFCLSLEVEQWDELDSIAEGVRDNALAVDAEEAAPETRTETSFEGGPRKAWTTSKKKTQICHILVSQSCLYELPRIVFDSQNSGANNSKVKNNYGRMAWPLPPA